MLRYFSKVPDLNLTDDFEDHFRGEAEDFFHSFVSDHVINEMGGEF
jgi:hypothetical protein